MKENPKTSTLDPSYGDLENGIETPDNTSPSSRIEEVTITPEPGQFDILKGGDKDLRQSIYKGLTFYKDNQEKDKYRDIGAKMQDDFISKYRETYYGKSPDEDGSKGINAYHNASDALENKIDEIPDKVIDYNAQHAALKRLHDIWVDAGKPGVVKNRHFRGYGSPLSNTVHVLNLKKLIAELAHPIQAKYGKINISLPSQLRALNEESKQFIHDNIQRRLNHDFKFNVPSKDFLTRYGDPSHFEYETHTIIEPQLRDYIYNGKPTSYMIQEPFGRPGSRKGAPRMIF